MDRRRFEALLVHAAREDRRLLLRREASREIAFELLNEERHAFLAATLVANRVLDDHLGELLAILEFDRQPIGNGALLRIEIVARELLVLDAHYLVAQEIDA